VRRLPKKLLFLSGLIFVVLSAIFCVSSKVKGDGWILFNPVLGAQGLLALVLFLLWVGLSIFLGETLKEK